MNGLYLLIDEPPIQVSPTLASILGLNEAIALQQLHYWLIHNKRDSSKKQSHYREGKWWAFNTYAEWQKNNFLFWSIPTVKRVFNRLENSNVVISRQFYKAKGDCTKWYSIDYKALKALISPSDHFDLTPLGSSDCPPEIKMISPSDHFDPTPEIKMIPSIYGTETTTETTNREKETSFSENANFDPAPSSAIDLEKTPPPSPPPSSRSHSDNRFNAVERSERRWRRTHVDANGKALDYPPAFWNELEDQGLTEIWDPTSGKRHNSWDPAFNESCRKYLERKGFDHKQADVNTWIQNRITKHEWGVLADRLSEIPKFREENLEPGQEPINELFAEFIALKQAKGVQVERGSANLPGVRYRENKGRMIVLSEEGFREMVQKLRN